MEDLFRQRVRQVLGAIAPTQREAASSIGIDPTKLSKSLNGTRRFTADELLRLADTGGVAVEWLVHGRGAGPGGPSGATAAAADPAAAADDERRRRYLEAAWKLISTKGFHAVRVADIAQACGTSTGAVHYYFPGKKEVLEAAMRYCVERAFARQYDALTAEEDAYRRMLTLIGNQVPGEGQVSQEWSVWLQFWSESALRAELRPIHQEYYAKWRETVVRIVRRGQRQGVFRDVDAEEVALRFTALTDGLGIQVVTGSTEVTPERMRRVLVDFVDRELLVEAHETAGR